MARPREFNRQAALKIAMDLFWKHGYEGVSIAELTTAMKIAPPSLYAAFGSKAELYKEAIDAYQSRPGALSLAALDATGDLRAKLSELLHSAAKTATETSPPMGCMIMNGMLASSLDNQTLTEITTGLRMNLIEALQKRFERAVANGELTTDVKPDVAARYFAAIVQGISVQAHDGAALPELAALIELSLSALIPPKD